MKEIAWVETTGFVVCTTSNTIRYDTTKTVPNHFASKEYSGDWEVVSISAIIKRG